MPSGGGSLEEVIRGAAGVGETKLFNNAAQAWNHAFFWNVDVARAPDGPAGDLAARDRRGFRRPGRRSKDAFVAEGAGHFGSGWVWLASGPNGS